MEREVIMSEPPSLVRLAPEVETLDILAAEGGREIFGPIERPAAEGGRDMFGPPDMLVTEGGRDIFGAVLVGLRLLLDADNRDPGAPHADVGETVLPPDALLFASHFGCPQEGSPEPMAPAGFPIPPPPDALLESHLSGPVLHIFPKTPSPFPRPSPIVLLDESLFMFQETPSLATEHIGLTGDISSSANSAASASLMGASREKDTTALSSVGWAQNLTLNPRGVKTKFIDGVGEKSLTAAKRLARMCFPPGLNCTSTSI